MKSEIIYTDAPLEVEESLARSIVVPSFEMTPDGIRKFFENQEKKSPRAACVSDGREKLRSDPILTER